MEELKLNSKRWAALVIAIVLFFIGISNQISQFGGGGGIDELDGGIHFEQKVIREGASRTSPTIAVLSLQGVIQDTGNIPFSSSVIYNHRAFLQMLDAAGEDPTIDGVIIRVNTPGGGVVESAEIHDKIVALQEKYNKPVYISMENMAASGGYYISAPANKIVAHPATITGSIGVIMESINIKELADNLGIHFETFTSGKHKDILSTNRSMTDEEKEILQSIVDEMYDDFVQVVAAGRDMSEGDVRTIADGRIYTGKQALALDLIDALGDFEDTVTWMEEDYQLKGARLVEYRAGFSFTNLFGFARTLIPQKDTQVQEFLHLIRDMSGPRPMFLYE